MSTELSLAAGEPGVHPAAEVAPVALLTASTASTRSASPGRRRCLRRGPPTSSTARCAIGFGSSTGCPSRPAPAVRGTVVHSVLERLFDLAPPRRRLPAAEELVEPAWADLVEREPELASMFTGDDGLPDSAALASWLASARDLLAGYFALEDPTRLAPAARELYVEHVLPSGLRLRGYVDRLDEATTPDGLALRVVDYKTGRSPGPAFEASALFQMRFYALVLWRTRGVVPAS